MVWGRSSFVVLVGLVLACGPGGAAAPDTETDTETDTEGTGNDTTGQSANPTATNPTTTVASNSGSATTTAATTMASGPADTGTSSPTTGDCPFGTEGCLCDVGAMCDEGLDCNEEGICEAPPDCRPIDEDPHDDEDSAYEIEQLGCGDAMDLGLIGTLEGPQTDWYTFFGSDSFQCLEQPTAIGMALGLTADVCVYIECIEGTTANVMCDGDSSDAMSPDGRPGCCGEGEAQIADYDCMGIAVGKDIGAWISVGTDEEACADYALSYEY